MHSLVSQLVKLVFCFTTVVSLTEYFHTFHWEARKKKLHLHIIIRCCKGHKMGTFFILHVENKLLCCYVCLLLIEENCQYPLQSYSQNCVRTGLILGNLPLCSCKRRGKPFWALQGSSVTVVIYTRSRKNTREKAKEKGEMFMPSAIPSCAFHSSMFESGLILL